MEGKKYMNSFFKINLNDLLNYKQIDFDLETVCAKPYRIMTDVELFRAKYLPNMNETYEFNKVPFVFPQPSKQGYDNLCLEGQILNIPLSSYSKIHLIGYCECEGFTETFTLVSSDGVEKEVSVFLYNSYKAVEHWSHERNNEKCYDAFLVRNTENSPRGIYCYSTNFEQMEIAQIRLPFNPCMHLFSITLEN
jgi:hypothetical protein